ncbi:unnamed protein product [Tuber melanosporum]|uniref:(Perigord truffle) hypothetical protein n=1 Tax=Tuber melanosporum (strain Mel28) TaxID=656061 RepID=D5G778_TUBMM|nr:unnamed protein product [Tuber melanosporum]
MIVFRSILFSIRCTLTGICGVVGN